MGDHRNQGRQDTHDTGSPGTRARDNLPSGDKNPKDGKGEPETDTPARHEDTAEHEKKDDKKKDDKKKKK